MAMKRLAPVVCVALGALSVGTALVSCEDQQPLEEGLLFDAGSDFSLRAQVTHIGPAAVTCCLVTNLGSANVLYLASPKPGFTDVMGVDHAPTGELHLANPYGVDVALGSGVPAFGYGFTPDGRGLVFMAPASDAFSLNAATLPSPDVAKLEVTTVIDQGVDDTRLDQQSFYTPSGSYLILGARAPGVQHSPDLYVIDVQAKKSIYHLASGAFTYFEMVTGTDTMVFENSTDSTTPGTPSVEGLYVLNLAAGGPSQLTPTLLDTHTGQASLTADGQTVVYARINGDLILHNLVSNDLVTLASNVVSFSLGPGRKGPIVYIASDLSLHVVPILRPQLMATPPGSVDLFSTVSFSPDAQHLYFFQHVSSQDGSGDLMHVKLPPIGDGTMTPIDTHVSMKDVSFAGDQLMYLRNLDSRGDSGDLVQAGLDGANPLLVATGVATGEVRVAYPPPPPPPGPPQRHSDMAMGPPRPVLANLTGVQRMKSTIPVDGSRPLSGALAFAPLERAAEVTLNSSVHTGTFAFSDDSFVLAYAADAHYNPTALNWVGRLELFQTLEDVGLSPVSLDGVSEIGPIVNRAMFVSAPSAGVPGLYFVKY
jgi:hypothetical protein